MIKILNILLFLIPITMLAQPSFDLNDRELDSGYIAYQDNTSAAVAVTAGDTIKLGLNWDMIERRNRPIRSDSLFSRTDSTIIGIFGNAYNAGVELFVTQSTNNDTKVSFWFDIGNSIPPLYKTGQDLTRGIGEESTINKSTGVYTLDTWEANGAEFYFTCDQDVTVRWNRLVVYQIHKGYGVPFSN